MSYLKMPSSDVIMAVIICLVGLWAARFCRGKLLAYLKKHTANPTVQLFLVNSAYGASLLVILIIVLAKLGVPTSTLTALLATSSLAIGLALKDSLANIASGILLVFLQPFKIGDFVEIAGILGTVEQVNLFNTQLKNANNEQIYIPNAKVMNDRINNKTSKGIRRLDLEVGISYTANIVLAKTIIETIYAENELILKDPEPVVVVKSLADSAVILAVRPWVAKEDYGTVLFSILEVIKARFDEQGVAIPFPQLDVHLNQVSAS